MPQEKKFYEMPYHGQVMLKCPEKGGVRKYVVGTVSALEVEAEFNRDNTPKLDKDGQPKINGWMATIIFGANLAQKIGKGDAYNVDEGGHTGAWHPPSDIEKTWPGVREALARQAVTAKVDDEEDDANVVDQRLAVRAPVPVPRGRGAGARA